MNLQEWCLVRGRARVRGGQPRCAGCSRAVRRPENASIPGLRALVAASDRFHRHAYSLRLARHLLSFTGRSVRKGERLDARSLTYSLEDLHPMAIGDSKRPFNYYVLPPFRSVHWHLQLNALVPAQFFHFVQPMPSWFSFSWCLFSLMLPSSSVNRYPAPPLQRCWLK